MADKNNSGVVLSAEHWIQNGNINVFVWEKFTGSPKNKPVIVLAHGSSTGGKESFDLQVPNKPDISLMNVLAKQGFDVFALDIRGFGRSTHPEEHFTTEDAASDLNATVDYLMNARNVSRINLLSWSYATQYGGLFVMAHPEKVERYISCAQMGVDSIDIARRRANLKTYQDKVYIQIPEAGWRARFYSSTPEEDNFIEVVDAYAKSAAAVEVSTPTSPQLDLVTKLPMLNPTQITVPTMMVHGQYDDVANVKQLMPFFEQLPNSNKRYVVVPNAGHMLMYQKGYTIFQHVVCDYFSERF